MEFRFETVYDQNAMTVLTKTLRKTIRRKRSRRSHVLGWIVIAVALLITIPMGGKEFSIDMRKVITWLAGLVVLAVLIFEDSINAYIARKRMLAGTGRGTSIFGDESYSTESAIGKTEFNYDKISLLAETKGYFVFVFDRSHGQVYDKRTLSGGTEEEFRRFIEQKTGKAVVKIAGA